MSEWERELKDSRVLQRARLNVFPGSDDQDAYWIVRAADELAETLLKLDKIQRIVDERDFDHADDLMRDLREALEVAAAAFDRQLWEKDNG